MDQLNSNKNEQEFMEVNFKAFAILIIIALKE